MEKETNALTPPYGRFLIRLTRPFPDFDFSFIKPVRRRAVELLNLKRGDRVLDVGCGPGGSFPFLVQAVGPTGQVVGIEISPDHSELARRRIARNQWENIQVVEAAAQNASLIGTFDGLLMFAAPDVYASQEALENILPNLRDNARVAAFGAKLSNHRLGRVFNPLLKLLYKLSFSTTPKPDHEPWRLLAEYIEGVHVMEYFFGLMFLASGSAVRKASLDVTDENAHMQRHE
jgi:demethylmenaquinone methyltransferase/2-methoxy-6-polyprenyl-1,4-benzoquinol methylase